jgi:hypothetical protein
MKANMKISELIDYLDSEFIQIIICRDGKLGLHVGIGCGAPMATLMPFLHAHERKIIAWLVANALSPRQPQDVHRLSDEYEDRSCEQAAQ